MNKSFNNQALQILIVGPGSALVGGVATFVQFIMRSRPLNQHFTITHMDTARDPQSQGTAGRFSLLNLTSMLRQVFRLCSVLSRIKPQIVHLNVTAGWSYWKFVVFMLISKAFNAKTIAHIHGGEFNLFYDFSKRIIQKLISWTLSQADVVVALSNWWKNYLLTEVNKSLRVEVIPNAPEESCFFRIETAPILNEYDGNVILFVGSIGKRKGVFDILRAIPLVVKKWNSAHFIFLGEEEIAGEKEKIMQICRENNLDNYVRFLGWVTGNEKKMYYQHADIFILPSYAENLPFSLLEAMAMGLPVITTPVGGISEVVEEGKNGYLIHPGNQQELAERILQLLENPQLREQLGTNAQQKVKENYSPETITQQWESLYLALHREPMNKSQRLTTTV